jgi:hypothetical protein
LLGCVILENHLHLLLKTPRPNLGAVMQSFLSGYAIWSGRRWRRVGHLFQRALRGQALFPVYVTGFGGQGDPAREAADFRPAAKTDYRIRPRKAASGSDPAKPPDLAKPPAAKTDYRI